MANRKQTSTRKKNPGAAPTAEEILDGWIASAKGGLRPDKRFAPEVFKAYRQPLLENIREQLKSSEFNKDAKRDTTRVATDLGAICRKLTPGKTVDKLTFDLVFEFVRRYWAIRITGRIDIAFTPWCGILIPLGIPIPGPVPPAYR